MRRHEKKVRELFEIAGISVNGKAPHDIQVHNPDFYRAFLSGGRLALGESYMDGWWDCNQIDVMFEKIFSARELIVTHMKTPEALMMMAMDKILPYGSYSRSHKIADNHYDLGNDLFEKTLDPYMQYTCGLWRENTKTLNESQEEKLDLICRKLQLKKGDKMLDIGCGWGGMAKFATQHYKAKVTGVSISKEQLAFAEKYCEGLGVDFRLMDYRDITDNFDKISTVGMIEHVGKKYYRGFMEKVHSCLKDDGLFVLHTIGFNTSDFKNPWLEKYIFPGCYVPSIKQIGEAYEGLFVLEHVENIGAGYDPTLMAWNENFDKHWSTIRATDPEKYNDRFKRMWNYYLLSCAGGFRTRNIQLWQFVFSKKGVRGGYTIPQN